jgi:hypothetical protein
VEWNNLAQEDSNRPDCLNTIICFWVSLNSRISFYQLKSNCRLNKDSPALAICPASDTTVRFPTMQQIYPSKGSDLLWNPPQLLFNNTGFRSPGKSCRSARPITHFRQLPTPRNRRGAGQVFPPLMTLWLLQRHLYLYLEKITTKSSVERYV